MLDYSIALEVQAALLDSRERSVEVISLLQKSLDLRLQVVDQQPAHPDHLEYLARAWQRLARAKIDAGLPIDQWASDAENATRVFGERWRARPDRPAIGLEYSLQSRTLADVYWTDNQRERATALYSEASKTLHDIHQRFPEFTYRQHGQQEILFHIVMMYAISPVAELRDAPAALEISGEMYDKLPDSPLAYWTFLVCQALYGDEMAASNADKNGPWAAKNWDMLKLIRLMIQYRSDDKINLAAAFEILEPIRHDARVITGYERGLANRIRQMMGQ